MIAETMAAYRRAQDRLDATLAAVPADQWDAPSACAEWTVRDVAGHSIWGQHQLRAWATGEEYTEAAGAPGAPHPATLTGDDPVATWRAARASAVAELTEDRLTRLTAIPGFGEVPLIAMVSLLITDHVVHGWDIAHGLGQDGRIEPDLVTRAFNWSRERELLRRPGFFGPELTRPAGADEQTRLLAFLGRAAWRPVAG
jgi:uncharacterized protein (TIGR03086 family)